MFRDFFRQGHELAARGEPFATAVVVRAERPCSGRPGDRAIVTADGTLYGWIGGSCAQPTVVEQALAALADGRSRLVRLSNEPDRQGDREGLTDLPMTCFSGGTMEIYIEPQTPRPRLLVVGELPVARALAELGRVLGYHVVAADPGGHGGAPPTADEVVTDLEELAGQTTPTTSVVVATHGNYDELALAPVLSRPAAYVGLVASRRRADAIREQLRAAGVAAEALARLRAPAGLDIGARSGEEIALSILAEIVETRRRAQQAGAAGPARPATPPAAPEVATSAAATAVDPICGMTVQVAGARHVHEHRGQRYYFCCGGCLTRFAADPERHLAPPPGEPG